MEEPRYSPSRQAWVSVAPRKIACGLVPLGLFPGPAFIDRSRLSTQAPLT
jgi:hypothetical protein